MLLIIESKYRSACYSSILNIIRREPTAIILTETPIAKSIKQEMSSIPQGAFCAIKMAERKNRLPVALMKNNEPRQSSKAYFDAKLVDLAPLKYNSKLMNSIWGFYNRYSPHNIKKTNDDNNNQFYGDLQKQTASLQNLSISKEMGKDVNVKPKISNSRDNIWNTIPISQSH